MRVSTREPRERIKAERKEIGPNIATPGADAQHEADDNLARLTRYLQALEKQVNAGFEDMTEAVRTELRSWLKDSNS